MKRVPRTVRTRLTAIAVMGCAALLGLASVVMVVALRQQLTDNLDESLGQRADALVAAGRGGRPLVPDGTDEDLLVQLCSPSGEVLAATAPVAGRGPIAPLIPGVRTVHSVPGFPFGVRVLVRPIAGGDGGTLLIGVNADDVADPVRVLVRLLAILVPVLLAILGGLIWWTTGRTLRPVTRMRTEMATIGATDLGRRVPEPGTGDEIDLLATTMNATLDRLEDAVVRQQRLVADASHELRGPLTRMRADLEVELAGPPTIDARGVASRMLAETVGLQHLVDDLLHLARSDAGAPRSTPMLLDLDDIVLREARRVVERGRVRLDTGRVAAVQVLGDRGQLGRVVRNLLENAERHASAVVTLALQDVDGTVTLEVSDDGAGIATADRERVFERFARLDDARTRDAGGAGLGLAIVRDIVERHGGHVALADGAGATFMVRLPGHAPAAGAGA